MMKLINIHLHHQIPTKRVRQFYQYHKSIVIVDLPDVISSALEFTDIIKDFTIDNADEFDFTNVHSHIDGLYFGEIDSKMEITLQMEDINSFSLHSWVKFEQIESIPFLTIFEDGIVRFLKR
jgi:hypothetical protein